MPAGDCRPMIPVSLSGGVEPGARTGTSVNGLPVVVWRGADGSVRAWPDRCPHRGMRLSFGFVRRNALVCIYHGWSFGSQRHGARTRRGAARGLRDDTAARHEALRRHDRAVRHVEESEGIVIMGAQ
jgi:phenylpropionate dioxygenase-like ring-hydroxylating dioxygenase large terminal subunit